MNEMTTASGKQPCVPAKPEKEPASISVLGALGVGSVVVGATMGGSRALHKIKRNFTGYTESRYLPLPEDAAAAMSAFTTVSRIGFGPTPGQISRIAETGIPGYIEEQLADNMEEDSKVNWRTAGLESLQDVKDAPDLLFSMPDSQLLSELQQSSIIRAVYSRHQLRENLFDFWTNHFNIYALKDNGRELLPTDAERVIRPHILGKFKDMLFASAKSPAMLTFLDTAKNKRGAPNENYARELMELHTVGVHSGYTLNDIQQIARCFTGWTLKEGLKRGLFVFRLTDFTRAPDWFYFDSAEHDNGAKYIPFLRLPIPAGGGENDVTPVLEKLSLHPDTANRLAQKLCMRFLGNQPQEIVDKAASAYLRNDTDIRSMLRPILLDGLPDSSNLRPILKRPFSMMISSLRALAADTDGGDSLQSHLGNMGQPLYQWPMPDGFPPQEAAWTGSLLPRWNYSIALTSGSIAGTEVDISSLIAAAGAVSDTQKLDALIETILSRRADSPEAAPARNSVQNYMEQARSHNMPETEILSECAALLLSAPIFQWR